MTTLPTTGAPRPGGRLASFNSYRERCGRAAMKSTLYDGPYAVRECPEDPAFALVPIDGRPHLAARIRFDDLGTVTYCRDPEQDAGLARNRWWLDEDGMVRAYSRWDGGTERAGEGHLVIAVLRKLREGDCVTMADPLELSGPGVVVERRALQLKEAA